VVSGSKNRVEQRAIRRRVRGMNDYERVARIIRHLDENHAGRPDLGELAVLAGLSAHHFHRLFTRWAGVSPKDFLQCLTLVHARGQLRRGATVFDAALDAGLSSAGRLHDLCVTLEAATPGEIKAGGAGWRIEIGFAESPFGLCCAGIGPRGVCHLAFVEDVDRDSAVAPLAEAWPRANITWNDNPVRELVSRVFQSPCASLTKQPANFRAFVRGTEFQLRVWRALLCVPPGVVVSYGQLATAIGRPGASRAVGTAVGSNPLAFLIPCHRVIRETGVIGQYRWERERKRAMLGWEAALRNQMPRADAVA